MPETEKQNPNEQVGRPQVPVFNPDPETNDESGSELELSFDVNPATMLRKAGSRRGEMHLLVLGQSNVASHGGERMKSSFGRVFHQGQFFPLNDPVKGGTGNRGSVWTRIAPLMEAGGLAEDLIVSMFATGGTSMADWSLGGKCYETLRDAIPSIQGCPIAPTHVVFHQGERDNLMETETDQYVAQFDHLYALVNGAFPRAQWIFCQASYRMGVTSERIREAQRQIVARYPNIHGGPDTDALGEDCRWDNTHLNDTGLAHFADALVQKFAALSGVRGGSPSVLPADPAGRAPVAREEGAPGKQEREPAKKSGSRRSSVVGSLLRLLDFGGERAQKERNGEAKGNEKIFVKPVQEAPRPVGDLPGGAGSHPAAAEPEKKEEVRLLVACMPKSGSTFLTEIISRLPGMRRVSLVPGYKRREQELCLERLEEEVLKSRLLLEVWKSNMDLMPAGRPRGFVSQMHIRFSEPTSEIIGKYGISPIVLVRNIFDIVVSLRDHIVKSAPYMTMGYVSEEMRSWPEERMYHFIADMMVPWYVNFFMCWTEHPSKLLVTYEELTANPEATMERVVEYAGLPFGIGKIRQIINGIDGSRTRKNKAVAGRGASLLPAEVKEKIRHYATYYSSYDLSPMGL